MNIKEIIFIKHIIIEMENIIKFFVIITNIFVIIKWITINIKTIKNIKYKTKFTSTISI